MKINECSIVEPMKRRRNTINNYIPTTLSITSTVGDSPLLKATQQLCNTIKPLELVHLQYSTKCSFLNVFVCENDTPNSSFIICIPLYAFTLHNVIAQSNEPAETMISFVRGIIYHTKLLGPFNIPLFSFLCVVSS